jgi:predicted dehydrogenase/nucleoside-diphosphate-sugar epimerase
MQTRSETQRYKANHRNTQKIVSVGKVRVALIGCGKVAKDWHLPILAGHEGIHLVAMVDRDAKRCAELAQGYGVSRVLEDAADLQAEDIDAAIVATPAFHHAPCAIQLMQRGIHVFVEKPMATRYADALAMVRTAEERGVALSVGFFRRLVPSMRLLKSMVACEWLGRPIGFEAEGGGLYNWSSATLGNMNQELAGGGALIDFGSHILDLLHFVFDGPGQVLDYRDNARGGIEADCRLALRLFHKAQEVDGVVQVARTRNVGHLVRIRCERGTLEHDPGDAYRIWVRPENDLKLFDPKIGRARGYCLHASWEDQRETSWFGIVRAEIDDWLGAIHMGGQPELSGQSALSTVQVIEDCYSRAKRLDELWVDEGLTPAPRSTVSNGAAADANEKVKRVLLTGATGFIGSRVAEILALRDGWQVRALVHNPGSAARLARLPVAMVHMDLGSPQDLTRIIEGCDAIVHCAIGWGDRNQMFKVTVEGTRNLLQAARTAKVKRFVHLSTIAVHDLNMSGLLDETTPIAPSRGDVYGESKAEAERLVLDAAKLGLVSVVLRPACVYGPFSRSFTTCPIQALAEGRFRWVQSADGPSNTVYIDNLIEAIVKVLEAPVEKIRGEVFTISDPEQMSWREFYSYFAEALGLLLPPVDQAEPARKTGKKFLIPAELGWPPFWLRGCKNVMTSSEFRALGRRVLNTDPLGVLPRWLLRRSPGLEDWLRQRLGAGALPVYRGPEPEGKNWAEYGSPGFLVSSVKAQQVLGWQPLVSRSRAMDLTLKWVRYARLATSKIPLRDGDVDCQANR